MPFKYARPEDSPGFVLWQTFLTWQKQINALLRPLGLTHPQFVILATGLWLTQNKLPTTQAQLAKLSKIDPVVISNVVKTLEKKGYIRRTSGGDLRSKQVVLTDLGVELVGKAVGVVEAFDVGFFRDNPVSLSSKSQT